MKTRTLPLLTVRGMKPAERKATFVAATQAPAMTRDGPEMLLMRGGDFRRYETNPVILDSHRMDQANRVVGRAVIVERDPELVVEVEFAKTARAQEVWELVEGGFIRALSVGFNFDDEQAVRLGEDEEFEGLRGPGTVLTAWELFEISVVPVPADAAALKRGQDMAGEELAETEAPEAPEKCREAEAAEPADAQKPERQCEVDTVSHKYQERAAQIRAIAPRGMDDLADKLVLDEVDLAGARAAFRAELEKRMKPVGSPEPETTAEAREADWEGIRGVSNADFCAALCGEDY